MLVNRLTQGIVTFVLTATIARKLGAYALGQYLLAFSYYYMFMSIASQGLKEFFTRELSREPQKMPVYLVNGTLLQLFFSIIGYLALVIVVFVLPYNSDTSTICYIMGLTIIPFALSNVTEAIFQAQEKMHLIALSTVPIYILRLIVMIGAMNLKYGVGHLAGIMVISEALILTIEWCLAINIVKPQWQIQQDFIKKTIKNSRTFFAIEATGIIASRMQILMLSLLGSELLVGMYGAIQQLLQPYSIICNSILLAAFPKITKAVDSGREKQQNFVEDLIQLLLCIVLPLMTGLLFLGNDLFIYLYKDAAFKQALLPLNIVILTLLTFTLNRICGYVLLANGYERFNLIQVVITTIVGGISGVFLISQYKLLGAAYTSVVMSLIGAGILIYAVYSRLFFFKIWKTLCPSMVISILMLPVFIILKRNNFDFVVQLIIATCFYLFLIGVWLVYLFRTELITKIKKYKLNQ